MLRVAGSRLLRSAASSSQVLAAVCHSTTGILATGECSSRQASQAQHPCFRHRSFVAQAGPGDAEEVREVGSPRVKRLVDDILQLSLLEVADLTQILQSRLGISGMPMGGGFGGGGGQAAPAAEAAPAGTDGLHCQLCVGAPLVSMHVCDWSALARRSVPVPAWGLVASSQLGPHSKAQTHSSVHPCCAPACAAPPVEEKTEFDLKLDGFDAAAKIKVIKEVRGMTDLGLKEAKELVSSLAYA